MKLNKLAAIKMRLRSSAKGYIADFWSPLPAGQPSRAKTQAWSRGLQAGVVGVLVVIVDLEWGDLCTSTRSGLLASELTVGKSYWAGVISYL